MMSRTQGKKAEPSLELWSQALCSKDLDLCNATLVPYVDALDPLNMSRLEIYVDPILEVQLLSRMNDSEQPCHLLKSRRNVAARAIAEM